MIKIYNRKQIKVDMFFHQYDYNIGSGIYITYILHRIGYYII